MVIFIAKLQLSWGSACKSPSTSKSVVTAADIKTILDLHNDYRRTVAKGLEKKGNPVPQPSASNMLQLVINQTIQIIISVSLLFYF